MNGILKLSLVFCFFHGLSLRGNDFPQSYSLIKTTVIHDNKAFENNLNVLLGKNDFADSNAQCVKECLRQYLTQGNTSLVCLVELQEQKKLLNEQKEQLLSSVSYAVLKKLSLIAPKSFGEIIQIGLGIEIVALLVKVMQLKTYENHPLTQIKKPLGFKNLSAEEKTLILNNFNEYMQCMRSYTKRGFQLGFGCIGVACVLRLIDVYWNRSYKKSLDLLNEKIHFIDELLTIVSQNAQ